jgi:hypothetical protein
MALMKDWSLDKHASIDWHSVEEVLAHQFTLHGMADLHPRLRHAFEALPQGEMLRLARLFLDSSPASVVDRRQTVESWIEANLFDARHERWCRRCGQPGHSKTGCTGPPPKASALNPLERQRQRREEFALRQLDAKVIKETSAAPAETGRHSMLSRNAADQRRQLQTAGFQQSRVPVLDERTFKGIVKALDPYRGQGQVVVQGLGVIEFHFDRMQYGLKKVTPNDEVYCRIERTADRTLAVDVRPVNPELTVNDVNVFVADCDAGGVPPITQMRAILDQRHEWPKFMLCLGRLPPERRTAAINIILRMVTFRPNREPVNHSLLQAFLELLLSGSAPGGIFFPHAVLSTLPQGVDAEAQALSNATALDMLMELADFLLLLRTFTKADIASVESVVQAANDLLQRCAALAGGKAKVRYVETTLTKATKQHVGIALLPSAEELNIPACLPASALNPKNLPVNVTTKYSSAEALVQAQCDLLRADTFTSFSNVLAAGCFKLPHFTPTKDIQDDLKFSKIFDHVEFLGRACSKDRDLTNGYLLRLRPRGDVVLRFALSQGQFVCITTGLDRKRIDADEIYWGVVGVHDPDLVAQGITVIHPFESDFEELAVKLRRNVAAGKPNLSVMMESNVFIHGYAPVMKALASFVGITAAKLPMVNIIVDEQRPPAHDNIALIPNHFVAAHAKIMHTITDPLVLDPGQKATMDSLRTSPVVLVQGPPGTGKSFIGCRVVESLVRYKRAVASGAALRDIDISSLPDCRPETLSNNAGPVVVITYKNHALDEFLVDLLHSGLWCGAARGTTRGCRCTGNFAGCCAKCCVHPASMVRIGGRSQATELQPYNLAELLSSKAAPRDVSQGRARVGILLRKAERFATEIRALERGELSETRFLALISPDHLAGLPYAEITAWLAGQKYVGKDTDVANPVSAVLAPPLEDILNYKAPPPADPKAVDPATADLDPDDGVQLSALASMRAESEPSLRDLKALRAAIVSREALELGANGPGDCPIAELKELQSLWSLSPQRRHDLFVFWVRTSIASAAADYTTTQLQLDSAVILLDHARERSKQETLRDVDVIGLTTTGCAMQQALLRSLKPSVLVVEEAAEILESQLLACLTESLTQIVLIGDHYQLQPKVETVELEKYNNMNVSLFERLSRHIDPFVLVEQRRMRSSIANLVRPFYDKHPLRDHASVETRPYIDKYGRRYTFAVPGLQHEVFLWTHDHPEEMASVGRSKVNLLEVEMVTGTVRHLLRQGVRPPSITVITPYLGQRRLIKNVMDRVSRDVRVSTVDRFQGDEADVIVLSLVRTKTITDFIRMRNRMIVACSRARFAMVLIGSDNLLGQSSHWNKVLEELERRGAVGPELPVVDVETGARNKVGAKLPLDKWLPAYAKSA